MRDSESAAMPNRAGQHEPARGGCSAAEGGSAASVLASLPISLPSAPPLCATEPECEWAHYIRLNFK